MKTKRPSELSIIIVNYNTADLLARCLQSIHPQCDPSREVIVVDNASLDHSYAMMRSRFPWIKAIANQQNLGFAKANNQALEVAQGNYVYFLNPDTELKDGALGEIVAFMESNPEVGIAGTRIVNPDGSPQSSFETHYPGERHTRGELAGLKGDIAWVLGASMIARRTILEDISGFDERFFLYGEDVDLCLSVRKSGWIIGFIPEAAVIHWGGASEWNSLPAEVWKKKVNAEFLFFEKHYSRQTFKAIRRANMIQALWRILTLNLTHAFCPKKEASLNKLAKYRLTLSAFRDRKAYHEDSSGSS